MKKITPFPNQIFPSSQQAVSTTSVPNSSLVCWSLYYKNKCAAYWYTKSKKRKMLLCRGSSQYFYDTFAYGTYVYQKYFNALLIYEIYIYAPYFYKTLLKYWAQNTLFCAADQWVHTSTAVEIKRKFYFNIALYFYVEVSHNKIQKIARYFLQ